MPPASPPPHTAARAPDPHTDAPRRTSSSMDVASLIHSEPSGEPSGTPPSALKRRASSTLDAGDRASRKRAREASPHPDEPQAEEVDGQALADELEQELQCGCCSALVYRPVVVAPCQHFFCGSCIVLWVKNGGSNCPACRGVSLSVTPSRALQTMTDILVRAAPSKARTENERIQADELYKTGALRIPTPRQASPEPSIPQGNLNLVHPCPHCTPANQWGWTCPVPIVDPEVDPDGAWHSDDGAPPGHAYCGNCESILALRAPTTTKCDFCQVSFCGIGVAGRCVAAPLVMQHLHSLNDLGDLIQCGEVYDIFDGNTVEVDIMFDYLTSQGLTPRHIYREVIAIITRSPRQFAPLIESDIFMDVHGVSGGADPGPNAPRNRICRMCATEVLLWGLKEWWVQERKKGFLEEHVMKRPDCPDGSACARQKDHAHAKEFNHIFSSAPATDAVAPAETPPPAPRSDDLPSSGDASARPLADAEAEERRHLERVAQMFSHQAFVDGPSGSGAHEDLSKDLPAATQPAHHPTLLEGIASSSSSFDTQAEVDAML